MTANVPETSVEVRPVSDEERRDSGGGRWRRLGGAAAGAALVVAGLGRRSLGGTTVALAGAWVVYRSVRGGADRTVGGGTDRSVGGGVDGGPERERLAAGESADATSEVPAAERYPRTSAPITVDADADTLVDRLSDPDTLDRIGGPAVDVEALDGDRLRWRVDGPFGWRPSWETRTEASRPDDVVRWTVVDGPGVPGGRSLVTGWVASFDPAPGDRGTQVTLGVALDPPGGDLGEETLSRLSGVPETLLGPALDRLKSLVETGDIPTLSTNPSGRGRGDLA